MTANRDTFINHAESLGLKVNDKYDGFVIAFAMKDAKTFQVEFQYNERSGVGVTYHIDLRMYFFSISLDEFLKITPKKLETFLTVNNDVNGEMLRLKEAMKAIPKVHKKNLISILKG